MNLKKFFKIIFFAALCGIAAVSLTGCGESELTETVATPEATEYCGEETPEPKTGTEETLISEQTVITFRDPYFEDAVREVLGKNFGEITVSDVEGITEFSASVRGILDISEISYFVNLEELDLYGNKVADFSPLADLKNLKTLNIGYNYNAIYDKSGNSEPDLTFLEGLTKLESLDCRKNCITDVTAVSKLENLKYLNLSDNEINRADALSALINLEEFDISDNYITDFDFAGKLVNLKKLIICSNCEIDEDTGKISGIKNLDFVETLVELEYFDCSDTKISDIYPLNSCRKLKYLDCSFNRITEIKDLDLSEIETLDVSANQIKDFTGFKRPDSLKNFEYYKNSGAEKYTESLNSESSSDIANDTDKK